MTTDVILPVYVGGKEKTKCNACRYCIVYIPINYVQPKSIEILWVVFKLFFQVVIHGKGCFGTSPV